MKLHVIALTAAALIGTASFAFGQGYSGNTANTPGHQMQQKGSVPGSPGASGYAPGHTKKHVARKHKRSTTGSAVRSKKKAGKSNVKY